MSGIVGVLHLDGRPVDPQLLESLTDALVFRGPDGRWTRLDGCVGLGHTLLDVHRPPRKQSESFSLDTKTWIVADARLDARSDLIAKLPNDSREKLDEATDAELILRAYQAWGLACTEHLIGDFAFGIWDGATRRLFCARDQMGVKPFYYAHLGSLVIFSNTLECIRQHPAISSRLNDLVIADFLLLQINQDSAATTFADIRRLPAAHSIIWSQSGVQSRRYWTIPIDEPLFLRRAEDYVDRFRELLFQCIGDRLTGGDAGVFMSGGLDSPTIAAGAAKVMRDRHPSGSVCAVTLDDADNPAEKEYARLIAEKIGIPIHFIPWGEVGLERKWEQLPLPAPEPTLNPWELAAVRRYYQQAGTYSRVFMHGEGPDHALKFEWEPYVSHLLTQGRYGRILRDLVTTAAQRNVPPAHAKNVRELDPTGSRSQTKPSLYPDWLNPDLESRFQLRDRWKNHWHGSPSTHSPHPLRPLSYLSLQEPRWQSMFEWHDPSWTGAQVEVRHPLVDLRMLRFFLAVPSLPWCKEKYLLRRAMRGMLPERVLRRAKEGLTAATMIDRIVKSGVPPLSPASELNAYVNLDAFPQQLSKDDWLLGYELRARSLNHWLKSASGKWQNSLATPSPSALLSSE